MLEDVLGRLYEQCGADTVLLVAEKGERLCTVGAPVMDLAQVTPGIGAPDGLARLLSEKEFSVLRHDPAPQPQGTHILALSRQRLLVVVFDRTKSELPAIRALSRAAAREIEALE